VKSIVGYNLMKIFMTFQEAVSVSGTVQSKYIPTVAFVCKKLNTVLLNR
jgi:hypothetical protein